MDMRRGISRNYFASGLLRGAALSGLVTGLVSASLGGVPNANATCLGIFGISINDGSGGHCSSNLFTFSLGLGPGTTATADGSLTAAIATGTNTEAFSDGLGTLAYAGGSGTQAETAGIVNLAVAGLGFEGLLGVGTNVAAFGGHRPLDFLNIAVNIGSADDPLVFDSEGNPEGDAYSWVEASDGGFNLAGNLFGNANSVDGVPTRMVVWSGGDDETLGFGTVAANVFGNRNDVQAIGSFLNATNWGNIIRTPNGSDDTVTAGTIGSPTSASWAFNYQGLFSEACSTALCGNTVNATGPGAIAGALGVINRNVDQSGFGVSLATQLNDTGALAVFKDTRANARALALAANEPNKFTPKVFAKGTGNKAGSQLSAALTKAGNQLSESLTKAGKQLSSSINEISSKLSKTGDDKGKNALGGFGKKKKQNTEAADS